MRFYGLKTCDTCRKAVAVLKKAGFEPLVADVRVDGIARGDLQRFFDRFGDALINRRSTTWRGLTEADRAADPIPLLIAHPTLMKRPVIEHDGALYLGWGKDVQNSLLG